MKTVHHPHFHLPVQVLLIFFSVQKITHQHLEKRKEKKVTSIILSTTNRNDKNKPLIRRCTYFID